MTPSYVEENQETNDVPMIEERIRNCVETEITDEERIIIDALKTLMINNEIEEYLPFKKVDQRKLRDVTKNVNAVIRHIEIYDVTQTKKLVMAATVWVAKEIEVKKGKRGEEKKGMLEKKN